MQIPVDRQGIPLGLGFIIRLPTPESDDESDGSDEESISKNQHPHPPASPLKVIKIDAQAPPRWGTSDDEDSILSISLKTKRNYIEGSGSEEGVCQDRPSSGSQVWDVTMAHIENGEANSLPDAPPIVQERLPPQKRIQDELVVPPEVDTGKRGPRISESLESVSARHHKARMKLNYRQPRIIVKSSCPRKAWLQDAKRQTLQAQRGSHLTRRIC